MGEIKTIEAFWQINGRPYQRKRNPQTNQLMPPRFHEDGRILDPEGKPYRRLFEKDKLIPPKIDNGKSVVWVGTNVFQTGKEEYESLSEEIQEKILDGIEEGDDPEEIINDAEIS